MLTIDDATEHDVDDLAMRLTRADADELAACGLTLRDSVAGTQAKALRFNGVLVSLFGVVSHPGSPGGGIPWMLCTDTLHQVPRRAMAAVSARVVAGWHESYSSLTNLIHRRNKGAIRFVEWLGFTVDRTPNGPGQRFYVFEWSRDV